MKQDALSKAYKFPGWGLALRQPHSGAVRQRAVEAFGSVIQLRRSSQHGSQGTTWGTQDGCGGWNVKGGTPNTDQPRPDDEQRSLRLSGQGSPYESLK
jgi:hypothetical protein